MQNIFTGGLGINRQRGPDERVWNLAFTQEWPLGSQRRQFSYTVPYTFAERGAHTDDGVGNAFNLPRGSQLVVGVAVPIGLTRPVPDLGVFL